MTLDPALRLVSSVSSTRSIVFGSGVSFHLPSETSSTSSSISSPTTRLSTVTTNPKDAQISKLQFEVSKLKRTIVVQKERVKRITSSLESATTSHKREVEKASDEIRKLRMAFARTETECALARLQAVLAESAVCKGHVVILQQGEMIRYYQSQLEQSASQEGKEAKS